MQCIVWLINVCFISFSKQEKRRREDKIAVSYPADAETLEHLHPLTKSVQVLIKSIHSIRTQRKIDELTGKSKRKSEPPSLFRLIASKNSFKEILDEKLKNDTFRTDMTCIRRLQRVMCDVMGHPAMEFIIMGFILANTVVLALHHHQIEAEFKRVLDILNLVGTSVKSMRLLELVHIQILKGHPQVTHGQNLAGNL